MVLLKQPFFVSRIRPIPYFEQHSWRKSQAHGGVPSWRTNLSQISFRSSTAHREMFKCNSLKRKIWQNMPLLQRYYCNAMQERGYILRQWCSVCVCVCEREMRKLRCHSSTKVCARARAHTHTHTHIPFGIHWKKGGYIGLASATSQRSNRRSNRQNWF